MKRVGGIFDRVLERENLERAFYKACRGKRASDECRRYADNLDRELERLRDGLADGTYPVGRYHRFMIRDPKEREICAAPFRERVLHHAIMNVCEPFFEKWLVNETYACRKGKGQLRAVDAARRKARRYGWFMKCDFKKYFDSIPHEGLKRMLVRKFKDKDVVAWFLRLIETYEKTPGKGIPIGNLTSQHLANLYLDPLDRFHHGLGFGYVRYMDDFVYWAETKGELMAFRKRLCEFVQDELGLQMKYEPIVQKTSHGMDFLGYRLSDHSLKASKASLRRYRRKVTFFERMAEEGVWSEADCERHVTPMTAFLAHANTHDWLRLFHERRYRQMISGTDEIRRGRTASIGAAVGTTTRRTVARPTATTTLLRTRTTTWASASVVDSAQQRSPSAGHPPSESGLRESEAKISVRMSLVACRTVANAASGHLSF